MYAWNALHYNTTVQRSEREAEEEFKQLPVPSSKICFIRRRRRVIDVSNVYGAVV